jgi:hypothetical protein
VVRVRLWTVSEAIDAACRNRHDLMSVGQRVNEWVCASCGMAVYAYHDGRAFGAAVDKRCPGRAQ